MKQYLCFTICWELDSSRQLSAILRMPEPQFSRYVILYSAVGDVIEIVEVPDQTPKSADNVLNALLDVLEDIEKCEITF